MCGVNLQLVSSDPCVQHFGPGTALNLPIALAQALFRRSRRVRFVLGEVLFHAHDSGDTLYLVCDGRIGLRSFGRGGHAVITSTVSAGGVAGLHSLFDPGARHPVTAVAMATTNARAIQRDDLLSLAGDVSSLVLAFGRALARDATAAVRRMPDLVWERAERRVIDCVIDLMRRHGRALPDGGVWVAVTHDELAEHAGVARPTASMVLQTAVRAGVVVTGRRRIEVPDLEALTDWAAQ